MQLQRTQPTDQPVVGMILDQPFPPDARVEREAVALVEAGYQVHLLCLVTEETKGLEPFYRGIYLHRVDPSQVSSAIPGLKSFRTRLPFKGIYKNLVQHYLHIDTAWEALIGTFVDQLNIRILHVHDLKLTHTALAVADKRSLAVIADLHENYPALMGLLKGKNRYGELDPQKTAAVTSRWDAIEKLGAWQADRIIVVAEEAKERLMAKGIASQKITVIPNTVDMEKFQAAPFDPAVLRHYRNQFVITYVGHVNGPHRGIHTVLEAMALLKWDIPGIKFVAAGGVREAYGAKLNELISAHGLENFVDFPGWMDESEFVSYIYASDVCVCPHLTNDHTNATFPNKLYLYHMFGKPVIASACKPIKAYIEDSQGGVYYESGNALQLAQWIWRLYQDLPLRKQLGESGRQAVVERFNWQNTAPLLIKLYADLSQSVIANDRESDAPYQGLSEEDLEEAWLEPEKKPAILR